MFKLTPLPAVVEPTLWNVVFHPIAATPWMNRLPIGRFKHVSAFAYLAGLKGWIVYDVQLDGTKLLVLPDVDASMALLNRLTDGCEVLQFERKPEQSSWFRVGFWCVPAVKHLIGLRSGALRPDALRRDLLRNGAKIIHEAPAVSGAAGSGAATAGQAG